MPKAREHNLHGFAGLIVQRRNRLTGALIGVYQADLAGMECDPETPYATVCEDHSYIVCSRTQKLAIAAMRYPDWCEECNPKLPEEEPR